MNPETIQRLTDLRLRCIQARDLRAQGREEEAARLDPSDDELREALIALRASREEAAASSSTTKRAKAKAAIPLDLNDLFTKKEKSK